MAKMQDVFRALSDPQRRKILDLLKTGSKTAGELSEQFDISMASLSHHYNVLKTADLIRSQRRGQQIVYSVNSTVFEDVAAALADLFRLDRAGGGSK